MTRLLGMLSAGFLYFCVGTVLAQLGLFVILWSKGAFSDSRMLTMWAVLHGIDITAPSESPIGSEKEKAAESVEQPAYEQVVQQRAFESLDIDLRESAIKKSMGELKAIEGKIRTERGRFDSLARSFDLKLQELETSATNQAVLETQQTLESLPSKQAKQQLLKLLEEKPSNKLQQPRESVVALVKAMPIERRKKILAEFKTEEEGEQLAEILKDILSGSPDVPILNQAQNDLQRLQPDTKQ